jgi:hypothetical protein
MCRIRYILYLLNAIIDTILAKTLEYADLLTMQLHYLERIHELGQLHRLYAQYKHPRKMFNAIAYPAR